MEDASEAAFIQQIFQQRYRRNSTVVVPNRIRNLGGFDSFDHRFGFGGISTERFFTHDHLAGFGGSNGDFRVCVVGAGDVYQINVFAFDQFAPIGFDILIAPLIREGTSRADISVEFDMSPTLQDWLASAGFDQGEELLLRRTGEVLPRTLIASQIWDINFDSDTNVIEVAVRRLRAKIDDGFEPKLIRTVRGMGYVLEEQEDE